jgi:hypothetical protein
MISTNPWDAETNQEAQCGWFAYLVCRNGAKSCRGAEALVAVLPLPLRSVKGSRPCARGQYCPFSRGRWRAPRASAARAPRRAGAWRARRHSDLTGAKGKCQRSVSTTNPSQKAIIMYDLFISTHFLITFFEFKLSFVIDFYVTFANSFYLNY